jgi:hypothetical protein
MVVNNRDRDRGAEGTVRDYSYAIGSGIIVAGSGGVVLKRVGNRYFSHGAAPAQDGEGCSTSIFRDCDGSVAQADLTDDIQSHRGI